MSEHEIANFMEITGGTADDARQFLQIAENNLETAITLYLENGGGTGGSSTSQTNARSSSPSSNTSDNNDSRDYGDEALARQLQESERDRVRAPIAPKTDILAGGGPSGLFEPPSMFPPRRQNTRPSIFNQGDSTTGSVANFASRLTGDGSSSTSTDALGSPTTAKARRLADLFRPPFDIMYRGSFEEAKEDAKEKGKWLMINIQSSEEFACQVLNRDLWSDQFVKDIVKASFVFLQYLNTSPEGRRYANYYQVRKYPHVAIVDSITGESMKVWEKSLSPTDFMMEVTEFLDLHPSASSTTTTTTTETSNKRAKVSKSVSDMSEEEQLNAAIAASLNSSKSPSAQSSTASMDEDDDIKLNEDSEKAESKVPVQPGSKDTDQETLEKEAEEDEDMQAGSAFAAIQPIKRDESTDVANSTRIQLRMGDGSRIIRRFLKTDPVRYIFEFVKADVPGAQDQPFELVFNRTQLIDVLDQSIAEAGLSNAAVNCVFV